MNTVRESFRIYFSLHEYKKAVAKMRSAQPSTTLGSAKMSAASTKLDRCDVGEVGRVLLSSSMLGYDSAITAARKQMLSNSGINTIKSVIAPANEVVSSPMVPVAVNPDGEGRRRRNKKKSKKKAASLSQADAPGSKQQSNENAAKLKDDIKHETERFMQLAGDDESVLRSHLDKLREQNRLLQVGTWRTLAAGSDKRPNLWTGLNDREYDSDSTSTTTTTTTAAIAVEELLLSKRANAAQMYLKGREQEKVLLEAREAITRAASLCQILADPKEPGALERRDVLIRAFRAITTDFSRLPEVDEK